MPAAAEYPIGSAARSRDGLPIGPRRGGNVVRMLERCGDLKSGGVDIGRRPGQLSECLIGDLMPPMGSGQAGARLVDVFPPDTVGRPHHSGCHAGTRDHGDAVAAVPEDVPLINRHIGDRHVACTRGDGTRRAADRARWIPHCAAQGRVARRRCPRTTAASQRVRRRRRTPNDRSADRREETLRRPR